MNSDVSTTYLGLELSTPVVVGACPLTTQPETVRQLVDAGAGGIVLPSILQEQIIHAKLRATDPDGAIQRSGYQPQQDRYNGGTVRYLETLQELKSKASVPVIASMNGSEQGDWLDYAAEIQAAGADALELNWQPNQLQPDQSSSQVEERLCELIRHAKSIVSLPIAIKLSQRYTNLASVARKSESAGASGLVLFTHLPEWDVCIDRLHWTIRWELSPVDSLGSLLEGIVRSRMSCPDISIAASGGIRDCEGSLKAIIAGADIVMITSEVYRSGPGCITRLLAGLHQYIERSPYQSLDEFKSKRPEPCIDPELPMRLEYIDPLTRSPHYFDPTPVASTTSGDGFGHQP